MSNLCPRDPDKRHQWAVALVISNSPLSTKPDVEEHTMDVIVHCAWCLEAREVTLSVGQDPPE